MKKLISLLLCTIMLFSFTSVFAEEAAEPSNKIEISFKVGDSTLLINGKEVTVETPYIAGEGTTLVPLRVITEAFGAEVLWEGETKTITLNYPDVTIILQIDNITAKVNDHTEELAVAPTLSASGVTMVPLRFISETFGAEVGYNEGAITVTKSTDDFGTTVSTLTQKEKIGDSYYGWTMNTPKTLTLADKSFDGRNLVFDSDYVSLYIDVEPFDKNSSFEENYITTKNRALSSGNLTKDEIKKDENGNPYYIIQVSTKDSFTDYRFYYTENAFYTVRTYLITAEASVKESILSIIDTFKIEKVSEDVYDLSEVKDDMRVYTNEDLKISLSVPADYTIYDEDINSFELCCSGEEENHYSEVALVIHSKTENVSAKSLAEEDSGIRKKYYNTKYSKTSDVTEEIIGDITFYKYTQSREGFEDSTYTLTDCFFEKGEYIYNLTFIYEAKSTIDISAVLASVNVEELDSAELGTILRGDNNPEMLVPVRNDYWTMKAPATWSPSSSSFSAQFSSDYATASIYVASSTDEKYTATELKNEVKDVIKNLKESDGIITKDMKSVNINGCSGYVFSFKETPKDEPIVYGTMYILYENDCLTMIIISYNEIYDTEATKAEIDFIVNSFELVKEK